jgi:hypothetical protein
VAEPLAFDPYAREVQEDPYPIYRRLRDEARPRATAALTGPTASPIRRPWRATSMHGKVGRLATGGLAMMLLGGVALPGCTIRSDLMAPAAGTAAALQPDPERALVVFLRPSRKGGTVQAAVYDDDTLVGISSTDTAIAYQATPGPHRFMVVSEAADFLGADLVAGRTYYARVAARMGAWRARFSLLPIDPQAEARDLREWLRDARLVTATEDARRWDAENRESILEKRAAFLRRWEEKPASERPTLRPGDGVATTAASTAGREPGP